MNAADRERLRAIRERAERATSGPWTASHRAVDRTADHDECSGGLGLEVEGPPEPYLRGQFARAADAQFIAHARDDIPFLLDLAERQAERIEILIEALRFYADEHQYEDRGWRDGLGSAEDQEYLILEDGGNRARNALARAEDEGAG